jgi:hypothetical protein
MLVEQRVRPLSLSQEPMYPSPFGDEEILVIAGEMVAKSNGKVGLLDAINFVKQHIEQVLQMPEGQAEAARVWELRQQDSES